MGYEGLTMFNLSNFASNRQPKNQIRRPRNIDYFKITSFFSKNGQVRSTSVIKQEFRYNGFVVSSHPSCF